MEDSHACGRRELVLLLETQLEYLFVGRRLEPKTISFADAFDTQFGHHFAVRSGKGPVDCVTTTMVDFFLGGIGRGRPVFSIAGEHASKSLAEVASHRGEKTVLDPGSGHPHSRWAQLDSLTTCCLLR